MKNQSRFLLALLGGALSGLALGILFAPDKGSETRKKIVQKLQDLKDEIPGKSNTKDPEEDAFMGI